MNYTRFAGLIVTTATAVAIGSIVGAWAGSTLMHQAAYQALVVAVLGLAVLRGRTVGLAAAVAGAASLAIGASLVGKPGLNGPEVSAALVRFAGLAITGALGGEFADRVRYIFSRFEDSTNLDDWSHVYNHRFMVHSLHAAVGRFVRYNEPFAVIVVTLSPALFDHLRPAKQKHFIRTVADYIKEDIRLVDAAGRLDDGRFVVLLPHTPKQGGEVVANRLLPGMRTHVGARDESITAHVFSTENIPEVTELLDEVSETHTPGVDSAVAPGDRRDQSAS